MIYFYLLKVKQQLNKKNSNKHIMKKFLVKTNKKL